LEAGLVLLYNGRFRLAERPSDQHAEKYDHYDREDDKYDLHISIVT
jgi:hypothetical protein